MSVRATVMAMRGNEELTNRYYASATEEELPESARSIVSRNYEDEKRHLAWIKETIDAKAWEKAA